MRIFLLTICGLLLCGQAIHAQKFIQMDMFGKKKAMRFKGFPIKLFETKKASKNS